MEGLYAQTPWTRPHHVCLVVGDLAQTEALLGDDLGVSMIVRKAAGSS